MNQGMLWLLNIGKSRQQQCLWTEGIDKETTREQAAGSNSTYWVWQSVTVNSCEFDLSVVIREDIALLLPVSRVRNVYTGGSGCLGVRVIGQVGSCMALKGGEWLM